MSPSENLSCAEFQNRLAEMIGAGENVSVHPHMQDCELCRAFFAELEAIAQAARDLFPQVEPPDDLWNNIESAIKSEK
jgi:predicted anti-sigma-YlaC factor YlaD